MSGLPQLAQDLSWPSDVAGKSYRTVIGSIATDMTTVLNVTGKGAYEFLQVSNNPASIPFKIKVTVDGEIIFNTTITSPPIGVTLIGHSTNGTGRWLFNESLKVELYQSGSTNVTFQYIVHAIK